jgi:hypothetical protein
LPEVEGYHSIDYSSGFDCHLLICEEPDGAAFVCLVCVLRGQNIGLLTTLDYVC